MSGNYGVLIGGNFAPSKKAIRLTLDDPATAHRVVLKDYGFVIRSYAGHVDTAPDGAYAFVGPDPERNRRFYGTITVRTDDDGRKVIKVK